MTMTKRNASLPAEQASMPSAPARRVAYTLAAGAAGLAATSADAAVSYSGPQNIAIGSGFSQNLNIDGDAFNDIKLTNYVFGGGPYQGASLIFAPGQIVGFTSGINYVTALSGGFLIDSSSVGPNFNGSLAFGAFNPNAQFNNAVGKFIGLSFPAGGNLYYGWVRVDIDNAAGSFVVRDWAYETQPGVGIRTIPEPATLGLLAAGAAGLATIRRRRQES